MTIKKALMLGGFALTMVGMSAAVVASTATDKGSWEAMVKAEPCMDGSVPAKGLLRSMTGGQDATMANRVSETGTN